MARSGVSSKRVSRVIANQHGGAAAITSGAQRHHGGHQVQTIFSRDDDGLIPLHEGDQRICRAQVDTDYAFFCHHTHDSFRVSLTSRTRFCR